MAQGRRFWARSFLTSLVASGTILIAGLVTGIIAARILGAEARGILATIVTLSSLIVAALQPPFSDAVVLAEAKGVPLAEGTRTALTLGWLITLVATPVAAGAMFLLLADTPDAPMAAALILCVLSLHTALIGDAYRGFLRGTHRFLLLQLIAMAQPAIYAVLLLAALFGQASVTTFVLLQAASVLAIYLGRVAFLRIPNAAANGETRSFRERARILLRLALSIHAGSLAAILQRMSDRLLIIFVADLQIVGYYAVAATFAGLGQGIVGTAIRTICLPLLTTVDRRSVGPTLERLLRITLAIAVGTTVATVIVAPLAVPLLFGAAFEEATWIAAGIAIALLLVPAKDLLVEALKHQERNRTIFISNLAFVIVFAALVLVLFPSTGMAGFIAAFAAAHLLTFGYLWVSVTRATPGLRWQDALPRPSTLGELFGLLAAALRRSKPA